MADNDQKVDKKMGQEDKVLIKDVVEEVREKDKTQTPEEVEAKIEEGYIKLKGDIKARLSPILQALKEAEVDGGLISNIEKEIHTNSRLLFFTKVSNSDINNIEEIRKLVQKESLNILKPLFVEGEINQDEIKISPKYTKDSLGDKLLELFPNQKEENKEISFIEQNQKNDIYNQSFGEDADFKDKLAAMAVYTIETYSAKISAGKLKVVEIALVENALNILKGYGDQFKDTITNVKLALSKLPSTGLGPNNVEFVNNFKNEEDMKIQEHIDRLVSDIALAKDMPLEENAALLNRVGNDKYGVDAITSYFRDREDRDFAFSDLEKELISITIKRFEDKSVEIDMDGFLGEQTIETMILCRQHEPQLYEELLKSFNSRVKPDFQITDEIIGKISEDSDIIMSLRSEEAKKLYGENGLNHVLEKVKSLTKEKSVEDNELQFIVSPEYLERLERQDTEREFQERDVTQVTREQKKENMLKFLFGMTKTKGLSKTQEWLDNLITNSPDKDLIAEAIVEFLEKQKETDEHFMDDDAKESRESVFEAIVLSGIKNMNTIEKMKDVDRDTSKKVLDKVIEKYNKTKSGNIKAILMLGEKIIDHEEKGLEQGFLKEPDLEAFEKPDLFGRNTKEEPDDDLSR